MSNQILSIITINYNNQLGLQKTMDSVLAQQWQQFEYLVIDGGSTDESITIIKANEKHIDYWVSEKDSGIFNAMNKGIENATGNYLLFLNSGDLLNGANALQNFIAHPNFKGDIIYGDYVFEKGQKIYPDVLTPLFFIKSSLPHQSTFFKSTIFDEMGSYDETYKIAADRAFYMACFLSGRFKFNHINYPLTKYDLTGLSNNPEFKVVKKQEDEAIFKKYYGIFYSDYKHYLKLEKELASLKRTTIKGILKRIKKRLKL
ncbi:glycosyltransferase family 2 protein [uncultured Lutibacter sp.]|uniref:glycosyltransferase family 2 protein n=1 Tax=uncultured Lutibacter sp. TaxID=437739 RepID=UPI0026151D34|nr:glycosyltransferase family 2 protein [uncultured Lutibacter sp.]